MEEPSETTPLIRASTLDEPPSLLHRTINATFSVVSPVVSRSVRLAKSMHELVNYHVVNGVNGSGKGTKTLKIEPKVWFANERTWISYLNNSILLGTLAVALFNASSEPVPRFFAYVYAVISLGVLAYGFCLYQYRITLIRRKDADHFVSLIGPLVISASLFSVVLLNFIVKVYEMKKHRDADAP